MGGGNMIVRRAKVGICDEYRGVYLNRGVFLKAPPSFFQAYPSDFEAPPPGWEKLGLKIREITHWDTKTGIFQQTTPVEVPTPEPKVVAQTVEVPPAVEQPVADTVTAPPKRGRGRPKKTPVQA